MNKHYESFGRSCVIVLCNSGPIIWKRRKMKRSLKKDLLAITHIVSFRCWRLNGWMRSTDERFVSFSLKRKKKISFTYSFVLKPIERGNIFLKIKCCPTIHRMQFKLKFGETKETKVQGCFFFPWFSNPCRRHAKWAARRASSSSPFACFFLRFVYVIIAAAAWKSTEIKRCHWSCGCLYFTVARYFALWKNRNAFCGIFAATARIAYQKIGSTQSWLYRISRKGWKCLSFFKKCVTIF